MAVDLVVLLVVVVVAVVAVLREDRLVGDTKEAVRSSTAADAAVLCLTGNDMGK